MDLYSKRSLPLITLNVVVDNLVFFVALSFGSMLLSGVTDWKQMNSSGGVKSR